MYVNSQFALWQLNMHAIIINNIILDLIRYKLYTYFYSNENKIPTSCCLYCSRRPRRTYTTHIQTHSLSSLTQYIKYELVTLHIDINVEIWCN